MKALLALAFIPFAGLSAAAASGRASDSAAAIRAQRGARAVIEEFRDFRRVVIGGFGAQRLFVAPLRLSKREMKEILLHFEDPDHGGNLLHALLRETGPIPDTGEAAYVERLLDLAGSLPLRIIGRALRKTDRGGYTPLGLARSAMHPYEGLFESMAIKYNSRLDKQASRYMHAGLFSGLAIVVGGAWLSGVWSSGPPPSAEEMYLPLSAGTASVAAGCYAYFKSLKKQVNPDFGKWAN